MMYAGDEFYDDDATSGVLDPVAIRALELADREYEAEQARGESESDDPIIEAAILNRPVANLEVGTEVIVVGPDLEGVAHWRDMLGRVESVDDRDEVTYRVRFNLYRSAIFPASSLRVFAPESALEERAANGDR